jgi:predicted DNA-binding transcriptional regulator AlpA
MTGYQGDPDLVTIPKAAALLGISAKTGYRLARAGKFPGDAAIRVGSSWRVSIPRLKSHLGTRPAISEPEPDARASAAAAKVGRLLVALSEVLADPVIAERIVGAVAGG